MAKYDLELAIIASLNDGMKDEFGEMDVKFERTSRRTSASDIKKAAGIDKIKLSMKNKKPFLQVLMFKNFTDAGDGWQKLVSAIPRVLKASMKKMEMGRTFNVVEGKMCDKKGQQATFKGNDISPETQMSVGLSKIATDLMLGEFDDLDQAPVLRKFMLHMRSGDAVLLPRKIFRSTGLSRSAAQLGITVTNPELKSDLLAISLPDLKKAGEAINIAISDRDKFVATPTTEVDDKGSRATASTPEEIEKVQEATKAETAELRDINAQLKSWDNPDKSYEDLLKRQKEAQKAQDELDKLSEDDPGYDAAKELAESDALTSGERKLLNVLTQVVEKNMLSLATRKKELLHRRQAKVQAKKNAIEARILGKKVNEVDAAAVAGAKDTLLLKLQAAGDSKYYIALAFNGETVKY